MNEFDVAIVGGGLVGLSLAAALQRTGLRLALIEPQSAKSMQLRLRVWDR